MCGAQRSCELMDTNALTVLMIFFVARTVAAGHRRTTETSSAFPFACHDGFVVGRAQLLMGVVSSSGIYPTRPPQRHPCLVVVVVNLVALVGRTHLRAISNTTDQPATHQRAARGRRSMECRRQTRHPRVRLDGVDRCRVPDGGCPASRSWSAASQMEWRAEGSH
jgi:hypothetical protein